MLFIRILWVGFFGILTIAAFKDGMIAGGIFMAASAILGLPHFWRFLADKGIALTNGKKVGISLVTAFIAIMAIGVSFQNTPAGKAKAAEDQRLADAEAAKAAKEGAAKQKVADAENAEEKRKGFHCLSSWDGSYRPLVKYVEENARNPDSFEHIATVITPVNKNGVHEVIMKYRAQNGFGGMNVEAIAATVDPDTCDMTKVITG